jgi:glycosyltransferase involved in cell wall biosynthesis
MRIGKDKVQVLDPPLHSQVIDGFSRKCLLGYTYVREESLGAWGMRVLLVTGEYPPMQGGVGDYTRELAIAFAKNGLDVHVFTRMSDRPPASHLGIETHVSSGGWNWLTLLRARQLVNDINPDAVQIQYQAAAYGMHPSIHLLPRLLKATTRAGIVSVTYHDLLVPYLFPKAGSLRWKAVLELARGSDFAVTTNPEDTSRLSHALPEANVVEIPIGSNIHPEPPTGYDREAWRRDHGYREGDCLLIYFGFLNASKGGEVLVRAFARLRQVKVPAKLLMLGGKTGSSDPTNLAYAERIERLIGDLGVQEEIRWTGFLPPEEVSAWLLAADVAVLPYMDGASYRRGSFMAALAHGLPIVTTEPRIPQPGMKSGENVLLVQPGNVEATAEAVRQLCGDPEMRNLLSRGARALSAEFSWDRIAQKHIEAYKTFSR